MRKPGNRPEDLRRYAAPVGFFEEPRFRELVKKADLVLGWEAIDKKSVLLYGRDALDRPFVVLPFPSDIAQLTDDDIASWEQAQSKGQPCRKAIVVRFRKDSPDVEYLIAGVRFLKGRCEYRSKMVIEEPKLKKSLLGDALSVLSRIETDRPGSEGKVK